MSLTQLAVRSVGLKANMDHLQLFALDTLLSIFFILNLPKFSEARTAFPTSLKTTVGSAMFQLLVLQPQIPKLKLHLQSDAVGRHELMEVGSEGKNPPRRNRATIK